MIEFFFRPWTRNSYQIDRLDALLSVDSLYQIGTGGNYLINYLSYTNQSIGIHRPLTDTTQWQLFSMRYTAQGGEKFLTIGNFHQDSQTTLIPNPPWVNAIFEQNALRWPIIFIDGVFVYKHTDTLYTATLPADTTLCPGEELVLEPFIDGFELEDTTTTYRWQTNPITPHQNSTDRSITVTEPGTYTVEVTINNRFKQTASITVSYFPEDYVTELPREVEKCLPEELVLEAAYHPEVEYIWSTGDSTRSITVTDTGHYWLYTVNPCYETMDTVHIKGKNCGEHIYIPTAFSPNGDGINDLFAMTGLPEPFTLEVYGRWGNRVFYTEDYQNNWDGTGPSGTALPGGTYVYVVRYTINEVPRELRGYVVIVR